MTNIGSALILSYIVRIRDEQLSVNPFDERLSFVREIVKFAHVVDNNEDTFLADSYYNKASRKIVQLDSYVR